MSWFALLIVAIIGAIAVALSIALKVAEIVTFAVALFQFQSQWRLIRVN